MPTAHIFAAAAASSPMAIIAASVRSGRREISIVLRLLILHPSFKKKNPQKAYFSSLKPRYTNRTAPNYNSPCPPTSSTTELARKILVSAIQHRSRRDAAMIPRSARGARRKDDLSRRPALAASSSATSGLVFYQFAQRGSTERKCGT